MQEKMEGERKLPEITVEFDADTQVIKDQHTYNIIGRILRTLIPRSMILKVHIGFLILRDFRMTMQQSP